MGELLWEKGQLEEAEQLMEQGLSLSEMEKPSLAWNYLFRAALHHSCQQPQKTMEVLHKIDELHHEVTLPGFILLPQGAWKTQLAL